MKDRFVGPLGPEVLPSLFNPVEQQSAQPLRRSHDTAIARSEYASSPRDVAGHASALQVRTGSKSSMARYLLQLQRDHGNRYVQRVVSSARMAEGEGAVAGDVEARINRARGTGQPLNHDTRAEMDSAFGADFGGVRLHTDRTADALNQDLNARAFATGSDLFFRQGEYNPGTSSGRELLAHELTHVVQQNSATVKRAMTVSQPDDPQEVEAEKMARAVVQRASQSSNGGSSSEQEENEKEKHAHQSAGHKPEDDQKKMTSTPPPVSGHPQLPGDPGNGHPESSHAGSGHPESGHAKSEHPKKLTGNAEDKEDEHTGTQVSLKRSASRSEGKKHGLVSRTPETLALPDWGSTILHNNSKMTLNPFARLIVDGKVLRDDWAISGSIPASFTVPQCAKSGEVQITTFGYWFQENTTGDFSGQGTATVKSAFDVNSKGEIHFKPAVANIEAVGRIAQMTAAGTAADSPPRGGSLVAQVGIASNDQKSGQASAGILSFSGSNTSGNALARGYRADVTTEKKTLTPATKSQAVYYQIGKHQVIGSKDPAQPANIKAIYDFLNGLPKDVRKELEDGPGDHQAAIEVVAQASVTTPPHPGAGSNVELTEKRRDAVIRVLEDVLGKGAKIKAKAIGELAAKDSGESGLERVATITVSWMNDACDARAAQAADVAKK